MERDNAQDYMQRVKAKRFVKNNGLVLRTINILRIGYQKLEDVFFALSDVEEHDFLDSVNYLFLSEYIMLRDIKNHEPKDIADVPYERLEAKLSTKGIKLLEGKIEDNSVEV